MSKIALSAHIQKKIFIFATFSFALIGLLVTYFSVAPFYDRLIAAQQNIWLNRIENLAQTINARVRGWQSAAEQLTADDSIKSVAAVGQNFSAWQNYREFQQTQLESRLNQDPSWLAFARFDLENKAILKAGQNLKLEVRDYEYGANLAVIQDQFVVIVKTAIDNPVAKVGNNDLMVFSAQEIFNNPDSISSIVWSVSNQKQNYFWNAKGWTKNLPTQAKQFNIKLSDLNNSYLNLYVPDSLITGPVRKQIENVLLLCLLLVSIGSVAITFLLRPLTGKLVMHADELEAAVLTKTTELRTELNQRKLAERQLQSSLEVLEVSYRLSNNLIDLAKSEIQKEIITLKERLPLEQHVELKNLDKIIAQMLEGRSHESDLFKFVPARFHLDTVMQSWVGLITSRLSTKQQQLNYLLEPGLPVELVGEPKRLGQILANLTDYLSANQGNGNTLQVTVESVNFKSDEVSLRFRLHAPEVYLERNKLDNLAVFFSRRNQVDPAGLPIEIVMSQKMAESMGGRLELNALISQGTEIDLVLPFGLASQVQPIEQGQKLATGAWLMEPQKPTKSTAIVRRDEPLKILVAEDSLINQKILKALFERKLCQVEFAKDLTELNQKINSGDKFNVLYLDADLASEDLPLIEAAIHKCHSYDNKIPVVGLRSGVKHNSQELIAGCDDWLDKPIDPSSLYRTLAKWS